MSKQVDGDAKIEQNIEKLEEHNKRDKFHLINLIRRRSNSTPNFALLIGAGASVASGIKTAREMISEWRQQLHKQSKSIKPLEDWIKEQDWYEDDEEYSILFEMVYDQPSQRRNYIEECVKDAKPSWGYIYLANLIAHNYFNVIFTSNFDDLINEACFIYNDLRPIVSAHDSAVAEIRVTSARPKIIKLHGDFLYDSIKNTIDETQSLEKNMREKFMQFAGEYGLVVIGYGGNDRSIMSILDALLMSERYFPNGLYWCIRDKHRVSKKLRRLLRKDRAYYVEIDGFDEFMAELHIGLGLTLPDQVINPFKSTSDRLSRIIIPKQKINHPIIQDDINVLETNIKKFEQAITSKALGEFEKFIPYFELGKIEFTNHNYKKALEYFEKAQTQGVQNIEKLSMMLYSYVYTEQLKNALDTSEDLIKKNPNDFMGYYLKGYTLAFTDRLPEAITNFNQSLEYTSNQKIQAFILSSRANAFLMEGKWTDALSDAEQALKISPDHPNYHATILTKAAALKKLNREDEAKAIILDILPQLQDSYNRACAYSTLGDKEKMLKELETEIKQDTAAKLKAKADPDFGDYRFDPDFERLVQ